MGSRPILPVKVPVTIGTMLNLYQAEFKINSVSVRVNKALECLPDGSLKYTGDRLKSLSRKWVQ